MLEGQTTSNENSINDETFATMILPGQTSTREYENKNSEKSDSETQSNGSQSSRKSHESYAQYLEYFTRYASTYAIYDRKGDIHFLFSPKNTR